MKNREGVVREEKEAAPPPKKKKNRERRKWRNVKLCLNTNFSSFLSAKRIEQKKAQDQRLRRPIPPCERSRFQSRPLYWPVSGAFCRSKCQEVPPYTPTHGSARNKLQINSQSVFLDSQLYIEPIKERGKVHSVSSITLGDSGTR